MGCPGGAFYEAGKWSETGIALRDVRDPNKTQEVPTMGIVNSAESTPCVSYIAFVLPWGIF